MRKYLKESLHWLHLALFKPITLESESRGLSKRQALRVYLKVLPAQLAIVLTLVSFVGILAEIAGYPFNWSVALAMSLGVGLVFGLVFGLVGGLGGGLVVGLVGDPTVEIMHFGIAYSISFLFAYLRPFHLVAYAFQVWRSRRRSDPFQLFRNSPVYWDEAMAMPLPFLTAWLVRLARLDLERGLAEITHVATLPYQRRAAQRAFISLLIQELERADSLEEMARGARLFGILPSEAEYVPTGLGDAGHYIVRIGDLARDYLTRMTPTGQMKVLEELRQALEDFRVVMTLVKPPVGPAFQALASRWLDIVTSEAAQCRKQIAFEPIPNPFVAGQPLKARDHDLFKGRKDIIVAIEENIINPGQRPALLLYGRRRIGKTSTLLSLPRLLSSQFVPVFIDCQDAKWRDGDGPFCYHLAASVYAALQQRDLAGTARRPQLEQFERYAFTRLGEYLDEIEDLSRRAYWQVLLTLDEYEKLEEGISARKITTEVLNQLRNIVQHRERIVVLFSGSHRFEEKKTVNWSDYLINVKTLELSFLAPEDARELITEPVPVLQYESGVVERILELTHCQPYLLQAVASDLVNYLNSQGRMLATADDLEIAVEKVLVTAQAYFFYTWTEDCSEAEREVLRIIATGETKRLTVAEHQAALQSLCHKEIIERRGDDYRLTLELFCRWILKNQMDHALPAGDLSVPDELVGATIS